MAPTTAPPVTPPAPTTAPTATAPAGWVLGYARRDLTPGATNPAVTQATIRTTICVSGWTSTVRPSSTYTNGLKTTGIRAYGYADTNPASVEEDHLVALGSGGSPTDPRNLWPQPRYGTVTAAVKDAEEQRLQTDICAGRITLAAAQARIVQEWSR